MEYHYIQTQGVGDVAREAIMTREKADEANAFLVQNTDYYWAEKHPAGNCPTCDFPDDDYFNEDALWEQHVHDKHVAQEDRMGVPEDQR